MTIGVTNKSRIKFKSGLKADINTTATKNVAVEGEPHWCTDTDEFFIYDGSENVQVAVLPAASDTLWTGTFTNGDGDTVTVKNGLITDVS